MAIPTLPETIARLAEFTRDAVIITEACPVPPGPRILYVNAAFTEMTGYSAEAALGMTPRMLQAPETDPAERARLKAALHAWQPCRAELLNLRRDGTPFWVDLSIYPVADASGYVHFWVAIQRDTTERHAKEEALRQAIAAQAAADRARSAFLASVSHEMRTPLNAVIGLADAMLASNPAPEVADYARLQREAGQALLDGVQTMLDYAEIVSAPPAEAGAHCSPYRVTLATLVSLGDDAERRGVLLNTDFAPGLPPEMSVDPDSLLVALRMLLRHGLRNSQPGPLVLRAVLADAGVRFSFSPAPAPMAEVDSLALAGVAARLGGRVEAGPSLWLPLG